MILKSYFANGRVTTVTCCHKCETKCGSCATADAFEKCGAQMRRPHFSNASTLNVPIDCEEAGMPRPDTDKPMRPLGPHYRYRLEVQPHTDRQVAGHLQSIHKAKGIRSPNQLV